MHFWHVVILLDGGVSWPLKYGFKGAMPALMSKRLLSLSGISEKLCLLKWSFDWKKLRNISLN